jgi:hypothetical protein
MMKPILYLMTFVFILLFSTQAHSISFSKATCLHTVYDKDTGDFIRVEVIGMVNVNGLMLEECKQLVDAAYHQGDHETVTQTANKIYLKYQTHSASSGNGHIMTTGAAHDCFIEADPTDPWR